MRLIDADKLKSNLADVLGDVEYRDSDDYVAGVCHSINAVDRMPTTDQVKHGHWIPVHANSMGYAEAYMCSCCEKRVYLAFYDTECDYEYCPHCGAKMDEEDEA